MPAFGTRETLAPARIAALAAQAGVRTHDESGHCQVMWEGGSLPGIGDVDITEMDIVGHCKEGPRKWEHMEHILSHPLSQDAQVFCACGFQEKSSKQSKRYYDSIWLRNQSGALAFSYGANGSKVGQDNVYGRGFMQELIAVAGLPLALESGEHGYRLVHNTTAEDLAVMQSQGDGLNATSFWCELPGDSVAEALDRMRRALDALASKPLLYFWSVMCDGEHHDARACYQTTREAGFPGERFDISLALTLSPSQLDALLPLSDEDDPILTPLGSVDLANGEARLWTATCPDGHRLHVSLPKKGALAEMERLLGVKLPMRVEEFE